MKPGGDAAETRGATTVAPRALRRIARKAASEVPGIAGPVKAEVAISGDHARLTVQAPIRYPEPVRRTSDRCRTHLMARIGGLTGLTVTAVDIVVPALSRETVSERRVR